MMIPSADWLGYAAATRPIIAANAITLAMLTLMLKLRCRVAVRNDSRPTG